MTSDDDRALAALNTAYWRLVDGIVDVALEEIFVPECSLQLGPMMLKGVASIGEFLAARRNTAPDRSTRHISANWHIDNVEEAFIQVASTVIVYAGSGTLPIITTEMNSLSDVHDCYSLGPQGWRLASRRIIPVFLSPAAPSFLKP